MNEYEKWACFCARENETTICCFLNTFFVVLMSLVLDILNNISGLRRPAGYAPPSPTVVEAVSLLGIQRQRKKECSFQSKEHFATFLKDSGITPFMERVERRQEKKGGYIAYTWTCPLPQGNPFLLKYQERSNGSCKTSPSFRYE